MDVAILSITVVVSAALLESLRQQHVSAIPLLVLLLGLVYQILFKSRFVSYTYQNGVPPLEPIKDAKQEDVFAHVALPSSMIYIIQEEKNGAKKDTGDSQ